MPILPYILSQLLTAWTWSLLVSCSILIKVELDRTAPKQLLNLQAQGLRQAYVDESRPLDTRRALENIQGLLALAAAMPLRQTSGLVAMQACFQRCANDSRSRT